jgi:hypothetical protein
MNFFQSLLQRILIFESEPQKIGLSQFKKQDFKKKSRPSLKNKDIKLSDLMRGID